MEDFKASVKQLEETIIKSYEQGVTIAEAEGLAGRFLVAQMQVSEELKKYDLDSRIKKAGVKAIRAAVYLDECKKESKKPSDVLLEALVNSNDIVMGEQQRWDEAEVERDELERLYNIFSNAHIHFRTLAKGGMG